MFPQPYQTPKPVGGISRVPATTHVAGTRRHYGDQGKYSRHPSDMRSDPVGHDDPPTTRLFDRDVASQLPHFSRARTEPLDDEERIRASV